MAKQLNSVPNTKGEKSKEENSSLVRDGDQYTKPQSSVENKAGSEEQGVLQEESGPSALELVCMLKYCAGSQGEPRKTWEVPQSPRLCRRLQGKRS